ncbi:plasmid replication protein RepCa2 (plasmid) [Rhizobium ruizarguesonis]|uniref:plasmid replication protein RepC n=1 Tax=Rhizobium ruizarguesonis TaxID=2081791 RepID=UPI00102FF47B|nr:plasmid replication protein RepC [Rhizobium ruizarguesonis]TAU17065.1 plasmid replication protein RepCa2 [Rhizobium ruizarguesonis]TAU59277.1 plasmid replication protein RepCa2 [Rhizobium ruizarguesonis]TAU71545.1 plasmid replication protein RepCa2 [Rhizobium ruizarguesonis]TAV03464.1 plasmid replication protein RepCa2 [Rhizobium ruizarguesonis]TAV22716.1 plasmid replication protein RepCa2 [Rhizobium ruizarguesonis]
MTEATAIASFRRVSPAILASARMAMANDIPDTSKSEISLLLKKAAPILGIDGTTYHVLDILLGLSRADDWKGAGRPIVAISNAKLAEYTLRSERTVTRCLRRIVEAGIAAYRDSPTGRRFVYRDNDGTVASGFGLDFTPARVRLAEIRESVENYQRELKASQDARRAVTRLSRAIIDACEAFPEKAISWRIAAEAIIGAVAGRAEQASGLESLHAEVLEYAEYRFQEHNMSCAGDIGVTSNINTTPKNLSDSNERTRSNERDIISSDDGSAVEMAYENKPEAAAGDMQSRLRQAEKTVGDIQGAVLATVPVGLLQVGCRAAQECVSVEFDGWSDVVGAAEMMRRMIGLSEAAWVDGVGRVGRYAASAILATVLEKSLRDPELIAKPGGYFRAMVDRAVDGSLHLSKSLYGLAESEINTRAR